MSREIDRKIAEMMGWTWVKLGSFRTLVSPYVAEDSAPASGEEPLMSGGGFEWMPHYSTDIAAAWEVVEWMRAKGWWFELRDFLEDNSGKRTLWAEFYRPIDEDENHEGCSDGSCPAEAICLAALEAMQQPTA